MVLWCKGTVYSTVYVGGARPSLGHKGEGSWVIDEWHKNKKILEIF